MTGDPWAAVAQRLGADLFLDLQPEPGIASRGRNAQLGRRLANALRSAIVDGRLTDGTRLPPYRSLAADLGLARGTVSAVYQELIAEGWLTARQGSGTRVAGGTSASGEVAPEWAARITIPEVQHDFSLGHPNAALFPRAAWIASTRRAIGEAPDSAFAPTPPNGNMRLRRVLADYLARVRGVRTHPDHIVLTTSVHSALDLLARTVFDKNVAVESYGLPIFADVILGRGVDVMSVPVDDAGIRVDALPTEPSAVLVTPSHQFPSGVALAPERRSALIEWARRSGAFIVEDDYDGELRYDREPVGALQALAPDAVIYLGSASKTLSPSVRIGWIVLPAALVPKVMWSKGIREHDASIVDQLVLADLIESGQYDKHIRRSRAFYRARRTALIDRLAEAGITTMGIAAGLHAVIPMPPATEAAILAETYQRGFALAGLDAMRRPDADPLHDGDGEPVGGIVVGFGTPSASTFDQDLDALVALLRDHMTC